MGECVLYQYIKNSVLTMCTEESHFDRMGHILQNSLRYSSKVLSLIVQLVNSVVILPSYIQVVNPVQLYCPLIAVTIKIISLHCMLLT